MNAINLHHDAGTSVFYQKLIPLYSKSILSRAIYVISRLCVAELLEKGAMHARDLSEQLHCDADNLLRVLNLLESKGIFKRDGEGRFENTSRSLQLRRSQLGEAIIEDQDRNWKKLRTPGEEFSEALRSPQGHQNNELWEMARGYLISRAIYGSVILGIENVLQGESPYVNHLQQAGLLQDDKFTAEGILLFIPGCQEFFKHEIEERWLALGDLEAAVRTGEVPFEKLYGLNFFNFLKEFPDKAVNFDKSMTFITECEIATVKPVIQRHFLPGKTVIDIGGGHGKFLASLLEDQPEVKGILFDLPQTVSNHEIPENLQGRTKVVGGDFFAKVPAADLYVIKRVLHDWSNDDCIKILKNCRTNMKDGAKLLVNEFVLPHPIAISIDVNMLCFFNGRQRTETEFRNLFEAAGWKIEEIIQTDCGLSTMVAV